MKNNKSFSLRARGESFIYAVEGIKAFFQEEHNARIHLAATAFVIALSIVFRLSSIEIIALTISIGFVWVAEIFNTVIEKAMDFISIEKDNRIKIIKDLSAAAVLIAALVAMLTGCLIFIPKILLCIS
ncbi:diacylglycerol kinase [Chitinophagaceae bacterium IBVUCB2]|nr:diacylglycerol kinase [Chitinophagaceae bacterium IBVUCB2]